MKRLIAVLSGLLVLPAFAEVAPVYYYEDVMEITTDDADEFYDASAVDVDTDVEKNVAAQPAPTTPSPRATGRASSSRAVASTTNRSTSSRNSVNNRGVSTRTTVAPTTARTAVSSRAAASRTVRTATTPAATRATAATPSRAASAQATRTNSATTGVSARRNMPQNNANTARASIVQTDTVNTPLYTGRVSVRSNTGSAIRARIPTVRAATPTTVTTAEAAADATSDMENLMQLTDYCKAQYMQCMDNFCNVLDDNQGRCSCSANLKNYAKTEEALKEATESLQDVAQQIQYIGLSADDISTLFAQTEAELELQTSNDNSQLKNDLDKIKNLIVDVKGGNATSSETGLSMDLSGLLDFNIDSTGFDLSSLFGNNTNTSSISNQRGDQLYKTAAARCKAAVLNSCTDQGVDASVVTNAYDLEIDKQCILYERSLTEANDSMASTVRNAKSVLQKARLMVAQQKNSYDLRGCVNALDSCMQDEFVCGTDYENCLDPTGKYIVNGDVVIGSTPIQNVDNVGDNQTNGVGAPGYYTTNLYATWKYDTNKNAWAEGGDLSGYIDATLKGDVPDKTSTIMSNFLQYKIGYNDDGKNYGMCMSVLNRCQDLTYTGTGANAKYKADNNVIREYLQRTLVQIKNTQDEILNSHAEECISDVSSCLSQNNYPNDPNADNKKANIAINACRAMIVTCMSVNGDAAATPTPDQMEDWVGSVLGRSTTGGGVSSQCKDTANITKIKTCLTTNDYDDTDDTKKAAAVKACATDIKAAMKTDGVDGKYNEADLTETYHWLKSCNIGTSGT